MKTLFRIVLLLMMAVSMSSCSQDNDQPIPEVSILYGTTWKCNTNLVWDENLEYLSLKFTSATTVEGWSKYKNRVLQQDWQGTYTLTGTDVTIEAGATKEIITGTISGVTMVISNMGEINDLTFTLQ